MTMQIPVNSTTITVAVAVILTVALWWWDYADSRNSRGNMLAGALSGVVAFCGTCFIWMVAFGLLLFLRGCE